MIRIKLLCVGKVKEKFFREALEEYYKRLSAFCRLEVIEVREERLSATRTVENVVDAESDRLLEHLKGGYTIALDSRGEEITTEKFSTLIRGKLDRGIGLNFIIGGSHGLSKKLLGRADYVLSFSKMTFPHQLFRVMFSEQLYRAFTIINNQNYHK